MADARKRHQLGMRDQLGHGLGPPMGLDLVVVAVQQQHRTTDLAIHRLADIERRRDSPRFHRLGQNPAGGVARPGDAVLDLLGRMRLAEDVAHEMLGEVGIVGQPMGAVELVPALEALALGEEIPLRHVGMLGPDGRHGACRDDGLHPFGMVRGQDGGEQAAIGQADQDGLSGIGGVHDGQRVGHVVLQRVGRHVFRPVGLAVAAAVIGDAAEALAEVGQLRLVDARMDDHPGRHEDHRLGPVAVDLVMQLHAVAFDESFLGGQLCAHEITLSPSGFRPCG